MDIYNDASNIKHVTLTKQQAPQEVLFWVPGETCTKWESLP